MYLLDLYPILSKRLRVAHNKQMTLPTGFPKQHPKTW